MPGQLGHGIEDGDRFGPPAAQTQGVSEVAQVTPAGGEFGGLTVLAMLYTNTNSHALNSAGTLYILSKRVFKIAVFDA